MEKSHYWRIKQSLKEKLKQQSMNIWIVTKKQYSLLRALDYHETDISHILDIFLEKEKEHTIIELLCKRRKISVTYLSKETGIAVSTLRKYRQKDEYLYKASFNNIYRLVQFFSMPETLFLETIPTLK